MRDLFFKLFEMSHFDTGISVTAFSISHIVYMILIFGSITWLYLANKDKTMEQKIKVLRFLSYALVISYLSDFFVHDFVYGGMEIDKLPFHICTILCPLCAIAQFNTKGHKIIEPVAILAILAPMMYVCYPAAIGSSEPWCYKAVQTMFYHGVLLAWGILCFAFGYVKAEIKNSYKCVILLVCITLWAKFGNEILEHNWFFLNEDALYIGLVEGGIIPRWSLMIINPIVFFIAALAVYGVIALIEKSTSKKSYKNS